MNDPLSLLPFAVAAGDGTINQQPAQQAVAAGVTLLRRCVPLVRALSGRRAAVFLPPGPAFLTAFAAAEGRAAVLVHPTAAPAEIAYQLADADVGAVFTVASLAPRLPDGVLKVLLDGAPRSALVLDGDREITVDLGSHVPFRLEGELGVEGRDEEAAVIYTSAMAGVPLGVILTHQNLLHGARATASAARLLRSDRVLAVLPWAHIFGFMTTGLAPLLAGASVTVHERFAPARVWETLDNDGITVLVGAPATFSTLLAAIERRAEPPRWHSLRLCICGGAPLDVALQERWQRATGVELRQGYGLTEAGAFCLFNHADQPNHRGTLGTPVDEMEVAIIDRDSGLPVDDGVTGEIRVRGPGVSPGYVSGGENGLATERGWLRTGDLGARRADGYFVFRGVTRAMFTHDGSSVFPREIELAVLQLQGVAAARVSGIPSAESGQDILLEVEGNVTEEELRSWCASRLGASKQPVEVSITPA